MDKIKVAIIIGINDYKDHPLKYCVNDADEVESALTMSEYDFKIIKLTEENATRGKIKAALIETLKANPDLFLFYFSGHGMQTEDGGYIVTYDAEPYDEGVSFDFIRRKVDTLCSADKSFIAILDCCHSGIAELGESFFTGSPLNNESVKKMLTFSGKGRALLASCEPKAVSSESDALGHGIFTKILLDGLMGDAADAEGEVTVNSLYDYASFELEKRNMQLPVYKSGMVGRIILGGNFDPIKRVVLNKNQTNDIENEAQSHAEDYFRILSSSKELHDWKQKGHMAACQTLEPLIKWFENKSKEFPQLEKSIKFQNLYESIKSRLGELSSIDLGTFVIAGKINSTIGRGTFGIVYKVENISNKQLTAFKVYHSQDIVNYDKVKRFRRGYDAMRILNHPHIIKVHEFTECPLGFFMDYIDGPNLRDFAGALGPYDTVMMLLTIADTLRHTHSRNVIHRDIKPENILLLNDPDTGSWHPFLTDFDLAWFSTATQFTKEALGTLYYASPEQLAKPTSPSAHLPTTDIYAFGQLCYYAVCSSDPVPLYMADNEKALVQRLNSWQSVEASQGFRELYVKCSQKDRKNRYQKFEELCDLLFRISKSLKDIDPNENISSDRFIDELVFSLIGLLKNKRISKSSFVTLSGSLRSEIHIANETDKSIDLRILIVPTSEPVLEGKQTFSDLRKVIRKKIDNFLSDYPLARRHAGKGPTYEYTIGVNSIPKSLTGIQEVRRLITGIIDIHESI